MSLVITYRGLCTVNVQNTLCDFGNPCCEIRERLRIASLLRPLTQHDGDSAGGHQEIVERYVAFVVPVAHHHQPLKTTRHLVTELLEGVAKLPRVAREGAVLLVLLAVVHVLGNGGRGEL